MKHLEAMQLNSTLSFVEDYNNFGFGVSTLFKEIFIRPFVSGSKFVGPLWTIRYELLGSSIIYLLAWFVLNAKGDRKLYYSFIVLTYLFLPKYCVSFIFSALTYDFVYRENIKSESGLCKASAVLTNCRILRVLMLMLGLYLGRCNLTLTGIYKPLSVLPIDNTVYRAAGIAICIVFITKSKICRNALENKVFVFLGSISPYIYAFHWPIELSLGCTTYILLSDIKYEIAGLVVSCVVLLSSCVFAFLYMKLLPAIRYLEKQTTSYISKRFN